MLTAVNLRQIWSHYRSICRKHSPLHMAIITQKLAQLVPTIDLILASLRKKQSCSVCVTQGKKGQSSFLHLYEDWLLTKKRKMVSFGVPWSFIFCSLADQRGSFPARTKSRLHKCQLTFKNSLKLQAGSFICRASFKKGDIK